MFISAKKRICHTACIYLGLTAFCGLFSLVYEHFSHQVYSSYMVYLFLFPLLGGVLPFFLLPLIPSARFPSLPARYAYHSGLAALTVGSCLSGIFEIYGIIVPLVKLYWIVGLCLTLLGVVFYLAQVKRR